jgi:tRNA-splicing ligase RtcB
MFEVKGFYNTAIVYADNVDAKAIAQIEDLCNQEFTTGSKIRIMSDVHSGAGCTIGTTMTITDTVVPNLVGVDIGCGLEVVRLEERTVDLDLLDRTIYSLIPAGFSIRKQPHRYNAQIDTSALKIASQVDHERGRLSIGTLGGGNHFIEVNRGSDGELFLVVHSGSRNIGLQVATEYQKKASGSTRNPLAYLEGKEFEHYLHDMAIMQKWADINRRAIADDLMEALGLTVGERFSTVHNYIDLERMILRKGAVSAKEGEILIIPLNMRDGSLICRGKGNPEWNWSAPHGAGRVMSRRKAKQTLTMKEYRSAMRGVHTTSVSHSTLDEAPAAYKDVSALLNHIDDTVTVLDRIVPIYNFKAAG